MVDPTKTSTLAKTMLAKAGTGQSTLAGLLVEGYWYGDMVDLERAKGADRDGQPAALLWLPVVEG